MQKCLLVTSSRTSEKERRAESKSTAEGVARKKVNAVLLRRPRRTTRAILSAIPAGTMVASWLATELVESADRYAAVVLCKYPTSALTLQLVIRLYT